MKLFISVFLILIAFNANAQFDRNNPAHLAALQSEVLTDPLTLGYDPAGGTIELINILNAKNYTVSKPKISSADIRSTCTYDAYNNLSIDEQEWIRWMTGSNGFEGENVAVTTDLRNQLAGGLAGDSGITIWAVADRDSMTLAMTALIDVPGSRAEVLFGYGTYISGTDWTTARDYTP